MSDSKTIAFFPEAAFGPALNSVGIAQACKAMGHNPVFISDPGFTGVYEGYGFKEYYVNLSAPMPPEEMAKFWSNFINGHIPNFALSPYEQIDNYVKECWESIVDSSKWAQKELPAILDEIKPDLICVDNVILFPAIKNYGVPWVRIVSCSENEVMDPNIPPHLSGCSENDHQGHRAFREHFNEVIGPIHADFNSFLGDCGIEPYEIGQFCESSPYLNLLLYPEPVKFKRANPLDPKQFQYLEGCVRKEEDYSIPEMGDFNDKPIIYISFGTLGSGEPDLLKRMIAVVGNMEVRALVNVGDYMDEYDKQTLPANVHIQNWFPQPSVIPQVDMVIHHGGNNSFTECLYFGKPAIIMPYVWDGHDNATRVEETGHGLKMHRSNWEPEELAANIEACLHDSAMAVKLKATSEHMQSANGQQKAAALLDQLLQDNAV